MENLKIIDTEAIGADPVKGALFNNPLEGGEFENQSSTAQIVSSDITYDNLGVDYVLKEKVVLELSNIWTFDSLNDFKTNNEGLTVMTHKTRIQKPEADVDADTFNYNNYVSDAFSYYNLRNEEYEDYTQVYGEKTFPNFCLGAAWARIGEPPEQLDYYTMFGVVEELQDADMLAGKTPINNYEFDDDFVEYSTDPNYETMKDYFKLALENGNLIKNEYEDANNHVYVDFDFNLADSEQIGNVPFFNRIRLPIPNRYTPITLPNGTVIYAEQAVNFPSRIVESFAESRFSDVLIKSFRDANTSMRSFRVNGQTTQLKVYDVMELFSSISYREELANSDEMFLRIEEQKYCIDENSPFTFYFYKLKLLGKLRSIMKSRILSFKDLIVENSDHVKEHVGFKVIKRAKGNNSPLQTFYFLNRRGVEDFVDTQIKFDKVYTYEVIAMYAVYGSEYTYDEINLIGSDDPARTQIEVHFSNKPSIKIVEVPFAFHELRVVEPPPIVPEITFYNEITTKNKLKIRLEHQDGNLVDEFSKKPMRPFADNQQYIDRLKQYFKHDDILVTSGKTSDGIYEIYRLEEPPKSYRDFEGALLATIQSGVIYSNGQYSRNAMFTDLIKHQKKYYYAFRVLTHRGNPSELSPIYVAEMYEDADETFLSFDLYREPEIRDDQNTYSMRKFIQILPTPAQTFINEELLLSEYSTAMDAIQEFSPGIEDIQESVWGYDNKSKFLKLRLESKNSGRKMDLNLYFKIKTIN